MDLENHSLKEKILKWCLPGFYIIGILGAVIYGIDYYNELQKEKERLLVIDKTLELKEVGTTVQLELNKQNKEQEVVFEVDDSTIVQVAQNGKLTSVGEGTTTVTVTNKENSKTQTFVVGVGKEAIEELKDYKEKVDKLIEQNKVELPSKNESSNEQNEQNEPKPEPSPNQPEIPEVVKVSGVKLDKTAVTLTYNTTSKLTATVSPTNATNKNVTWKSSDVSLVTVDASGNIKAVGNRNGLATITVTTEDGKYKDSIIVTVKEVSTAIKVKGVKLDKTALTLTYNTTSKLTATVSPTNATNKKVTWKSSDVSLVTVDANGNIKAVGNKDAKVTITATTIDGKHSASATVTVKAVSTTVKVSGVKLDKTALTLTYNTTSKLTATVSPTNATNKKVTWKSSDVSLVTVDANGNIKAVGNKDTKVTITATTIDGKHSASATVTVKAVSQVIKVTGLNVSTDKVTLKYGENYKINAEVLPTNATNKKVTWTSMNPNLVTVDNQGNVFAKSGKVGITTIELKTEDGGHSKKIDVVVVPAGDIISFSGKINESFMTNVKLNRKSAVMQSFIIYNNNIYISQQQSGASGSYINKLGKNNYDNGARKISDVAIILDGGHAGNIDLEVTNNIPYIWTSCGDEIEGEPKKSYHCRIQLDKLTFGARETSKFSQDKVQFKNSGGVLVAVDDINRTFVLMYDYWMYVYNLDDYLNGNARLISKFKVNSKSRQGFDVHENYIYVYEGLTAPLLSVYTLSGERIDRKYIAKPDTVNVWEAEGVKIYNNKIYVGMAKHDSETGGKTANIYILN